MNLCLCNKSGFPDTLLFFSRGIFVLSLWRLFTFLSFCNKSGFPDTLFLFTLLVFSYSRWLCFCSCVLFYFHLNIEFSNNIVLALVGCFVYTVSINICIFRDLWQEFGFVFGRMMLWFAQKNKIQIHDIK